jgi:hypothetical protein
VKVRGYVRVTLPCGETIELPVVPGILKHLSVEQLEELLEKPAVARKYTRESLRVAPWNVIREFPRDWLLRCLPEADLPTPRRRALEFLLT